MTGCGRHRCPLAGAPCLVFHAVTGFSITTLVHPRHLQARRRHCSTSRHGHYELVPSGDPELPVDAPQVVFDRLRAEEERRCGLPGRAALGRKQCDLQLLWRRLCGACRVRSPDGLPAGGQLRTGDLAPWLGPEVVEDIDRLLQLPPGCHSLPALEGVVEKLERGARVADVGCGHGASTVLMAQAFPNSTFVGSDYHDGSIAIAQKRADEAGVGDRVSFEVAPAAAYAGREFDLVTMFDCLHDMGDPVGAARHVLASLAADGTWLIVEPAAGDRVEDNLNPVGRAYYAFSTLLCTPSSLAQEVGLALGAQAGEARIRNVVTSAGFTKFRRAAETPFNLVFEARP